MCRTFGIKLVVQSKKQCRIEWFGFNNSTGYSRLKMKMFIWSWCAECYFKATGKLGKFSVNLTLNTNCVCSSGIRKRWFMDCSAPGEERLCN